MQPSSAAKPSNPFAALIGVSSLVAAWLYVAGFSFRWAYYYNFGVQPLVYSLNIQSFLIVALEFIRTPRALWLLLLSVVVPVIILNLSLIGVRLLANERTAFASAISSLLQRIGLSSPLVVDGLRAFVIVFATYRLGSQLGSEAFLVDVSNSPQNTLPIVTAVLEVGKESSALALACGATPGKPPPYIGDADHLRNLVQFSQTCNIDNVTWRLLYRDENFIYLFASQVQKDGEYPRRPLTLVLPSSKSTYLIME
ncbi:hypothetical protein [Ralstonia pseudosolanacearum]